MCVCGEDGFRNLCTKHRLHKQRETCPQFFFRTFAHMFFLISVLRQKPEEHFRAVLLRSESCAPPDGTPVLPGAEGGEIHTVE